MIRVDFGCLVRIIIINLFLQVVNLALYYRLEYSRRERGEYRKGIFEGENIIILIPREICEIIMIS